MGCAASYDTGTGAVVISQPGVTRTYHVPTVVIPQSTSVVQVQQQMPTVAVLPPSKQPQRQPVTKEMIVRFVFLSQSIAKLEQKNIMELFHTMLKKKDELQAEINSLDQKCKDIERNIQNYPELNRNTAAANVLASSGSSESEKTPEEKAFQEEWNNLDIARSQLEQRKARMVSLVEQTAALKKENDDYFLFCNEQDNILEIVFGGIYGSELEGELEDKLDTLVKKEQYIKSTLDKCKRAEFMFAAATRQLESAAQRWNNFIVQMPIATSYQYNMVRLKGISEIRNSLISADQNLRNAQQSMSRGPGTFNLPYCTPKEFGFLQRSINQILFDASAKQRQLNAGQFYQYMTNRASVLRDTLSRINAMILTDLKQAGGESSRVRKQLRRERVMLMKELAEEAGLELEIEDDAESDTSSEHGDMSFDEADVFEAEQIESDEALGKEMEEAKAHITDEEVVADVAVDGGKEEEGEKLPLDELAPAPTKNELIGSLDTIMAAYEEQKKTLQQEQESAKAKQEARIKEKLRRKKSEQMRAIQEAME